MIGRYSFLALLLSTMIESRSVEIESQDCFGLPGNPIKVDGAVVTHSKQPGRVVCYFAPPESSQYLGVQVNALKLPKEFAGCPTLSLNEFSSTRDKLLDESDTNLRIPINVPSDVNPIFTSDCTNFNKTIDKVVRTSSPGLTLQLVFDPSSANAAHCDFQFTMSSYVLSASHTCPEQTFRCWGPGEMCIPESITCDSADNCFDGSDEGSFLCTNRINGIPVALFAIIIVVSFLGLILIVITIVFLLRRRRARAQRQEETWLDMNIRHPQKDALLSPEDEAKPEK